jgi:hypothetical protein
MGEAAYRQLSIDRLTDHISRFSLAAIGYAEPFSKPAGDNVTAAAH